MVDGSPRPLAPAMPRQPTWPPGSSRTTDPAMPWEPTWPAGALGPQLLPCLGYQKATQQPADKSSRQAPRSNMAGRSPGPTAPALPWEPKWLAAILGPQIPPCPGNQHCRPSAPGPQLSPCPEYKHGFLAEQGTGLPPCPGIQHGRLAAQSPQIPPCPGNQHGWRQPQAHSSRHALATNMAAQQPWD